MPVILASDRESHKDHELQDSLDDKAGPCLKRGKKSRGWRVDSVMKRGPESKSWHSHQVANNAPLLQLQEIQLLSPA